jgi:hypothetical protein
LDFRLTRQIIEASAKIVVESKKEDINSGLGQCVISIPVAPELLISLSSLPLRLRAFAVKSFRCNRKRYYGFIPVLCNCQMSTVNCYNNSLKKNLMSYSQFTLQQVTQEFKI